jgi:hypothetical protein
VADKADAYNRKGDDTTGYHRLFNVCVARLFYFALAREQVDDGHAYGHAILYLIEYDGLTGIGYV